MTEQQITDSVTNGLSSALNLIEQRREEDNKSELNLTDAERLLIRVEIEHYLKTAV